MMLRARRLLRRGWARPALLLAVGSGCLLLLL